MSVRRPRLLDCNPRWGTRYGGSVECFLTFDCPEGHSRCWHTIPFTPDLTGNPISRESATWERYGDDFAELTLTPSIRRHVTRNSDTGEVIDPCHMHVNLTKGVFEFAGDSGPVL
jgi:hypothetical protein